MSAPRVERGAKPIRKLGTKSLIVERKSSAGNASMKAWCQDCRQNTPHLVEHRLEQGAEGMEFDDAVCAVCRGITACFDAHLAVAPADTDLPYDQHPAITVH